MKNNSENILKSLKQTEDHTLISLSGDLTIKNAREIASFFEAASGERVVIELNEPTAIDLSFIQILALYTNACVQRGVRVQIKPSLNEADIKLLSSTGFSHVLQLSQS